LRYVFGPVPSRRLGKSLGIDPVPLKTCNFSCVYCQLGHTRPPAVERRAYVPTEEVITEIERALEGHEPGSIDWLTFVGSGETTLHSRLGWLIHRVKDMSELPVAVITNGSLLYRPEVRRELAAADAVLPSLDAAGDLLFGLINRPHRSLTLQRHIEGLTAFRREYDGKLWLEVMLVRGINDSEESLLDLAEALRSIQPDEVQINVPTRPPAEPWVEAPDRATLELAVTILGGVCHVLQPSAGSFELTLDGDAIEDLLSIITRHPLREEELLTALSRKVPGRVLETFAQLAESGRAKPIERFGTRFWCATGARFPDEFSWTQEAVSTAVPYRPGV